MPIPKCGDVVFRPAFSDAQNPISLLRCVTSSRIMCRYYIKAFILPLPSATTGPCTGGRLELPTVLWGDVFIPCSDGHAQIRVTYRSMLESWLVQFERCKVYWMKPKTRHTAYAGHGGKIRLSTTPVVSGGSFGPASPQSLGVIRLAALFRKCCALALGTE